MPISRGSAWGAPGRLPPDGVVVHSDGEASALVERHRRAGEPIPAIGLLGGDLWRTLGGLGRLDITFPIDAVEARVDGERHWFVTHLVARTRRWSYALVAMNAQWLGRWNTGPRAHPNDGLVDLYEARLAFGQRLAVRRRLRHGAHLPHPGITERRTPETTVSFPRPLPVVVDGRPVGAARELALRALPDALTIVV